MDDRWEQVREEAGRRLQGLLDEEGLTNSRPGPDDWLVVVEAVDDERPLQVHVHLGDYTVFFTAFLIRGPRDNVEDVYRLLLRHQATRTPVRFCLDEDDDVLLKAELPIERLSAEELDRIIGSLLEHHGRTFWPVLRLGFASFFDERPTDNSAT